MAHYESFNPADHEFSNLSFPIITKFVDYTFSDLDASDDLRIAVDSGFVVLGVAHEVTTAFSGGTPALDIGDGTDADAWIVNTSLTLGTVGNFFVSWAGAQPNVGGSKFNSAGVVQLSHAAGLTAGAGRVYLFMLDTNGNWRTGSYI